MTVYEIITARIMEKLQAGVIPWRTPWRSTEGPKNLISRKAYRGVNVFLLASMGYESEYWLTFNQAKELGGNVRKGEHGVPIVFWKEWQREDRETGELEAIPVLRYFVVFNSSQCDLPAGTVPTTKQQPPFQPIAECERIVADMPSRPEINHGGDRACYSPSLDLVRMPKPEAFNRAESYYSVLYHELTHATGHESRLGRLKGTSQLAAYGTPDYAKEELVAEMGSAFLCGRSAIEQQTLDNAAAYVQGWLRALKNDSKMVVIAAAQAQKAADFILHRSESY